jgi:DNA-binding MarR family transcriptional regulator
VDSVKEANEIPMYQPELLEIAQSLTGLLPRLMRGLSSSDQSSRREKYLTEELPLAQLRVCGVLSDGPRAMSVLSRELGMSLSALTQIANRLERSALVKRTAAEDDRRVRCLQLTSRGERMMRKRRDARLHNSVAVLEQLSAPERVLVLAAMETLVSACARAQSNPKADRRVDAAANGNGKHRRPQTIKNSKARTSL